MKLKPDKVRHRKYLIIQSRGKQLTSTAEQDAEYILCYKQRSHEKISG